MTETQLSKWRERSKAHGGYLPHLLPASWARGRSLCGLTASPGGPQSLPYHALQPHRSRDHHRVQVCVCTYMCVPVRACVRTVVPRRTRVSSPQATVPHPRGPSSKLCEAHPPLFPEDISSHSSGVSRTRAHEVSRDAPGEQRHARQVTGDTAPAAGPAKAARSEEPRTPPPTPDTHTGDQRAWCVPSN